MKTIFKANYVLKYFPKGCNVCGGNITYENYMYVCDRCSSFAKAHVKTTVSSKEHAPVHKLLTIDEQNLKGTLINLLNYFWTKKPDGKVIINQVFRVFIPKTSNRTKVYIWLGKEIKGEQWYQEYITAQRSILNIGMEFNKHDYLKAIELCENILANDK